jgi:hypothetical protein
LLAGLDPFRLLNSDDWEEIGLMQVIAVRALDFQMSKINEDLANRIVNKMGKLLGAK